MGLPPNYRLFWAAHTLSVASPPTPKRVVRAFHFNRCRNASTFSHVQNGQSLSIILTITNFGNHHLSKEINAKKEILLKEMRFKDGPESFRHRHTFLGNRVVKS